MRKQLFLFLMGLSYLVSTQAQMPDSTGKPTQLTRGGYFDNVHDRWGNVSSIDVLSVNDTMRADAVARVNHTARRIMPTARGGTSYCTNTGYFNLYYDADFCNGCDAATQTAIQNVFCQVFNDISAFISSPLSTTGNKVNINIRNIASLNAPNGILGWATSFYLTPGVSCSGGIADNVMWQTINSGVDGYTNAVQPLYSSNRYGVNGNPYYHGMLAFNFSGINWHTDMTTPPGYNEYDLYSVALHEFTHALGFASLIGSDGSSDIGGNYYSRYDKYLQDYQGKPLITQKTGLSCNPLYPDAPCNSMYASIFNVLADSTGIGGTQYLPDYTNCSYAVKYVSTRDTVPVYSPSGYSAGSSFSHFEDECIINALCPSFGVCNDQYFVMSNGGGPGSMKRFWKPQERMALWDLGYQVSDSFGSATNLNGYNYGNSNTALQVVGINDGFDSSGNYQYVTQVAGDSITIKPIGNDFHCAKLSCPEIVYGSGSIASITDTSFVYAPPTTLDYVQNGGVYLLRYLPVDSLGNVGNITYVYVYVLNPAVCTLPPPCNNMLTNGDFEKHTFCGAIRTDSLGAQLDCWNIANGGPDIHSLNCGNNCTLGTYTLGTLPAVAPPTLSNSTSNTAVIGMQSNIDSFGYSKYSWEGIWQTLSTPLIPNHQYKISFWAVVHNNPTTPSFRPTSFDPNDCKDAIIAFASGSQIKAFNTASAPLGGLTPLCMDTILNNTQRMGWTHYTDTFTFHPLSDNPESQFYIALLLDSSKYQENTYLFLDDVVLLPADQVGSLDGATTHKCVGDTIQDLSAYFHPTIPGGVFSGVGVSANSTGGYLFVPDSVGSYQLNYTYKKADSCSITLITPPIIVQGFTVPVITGDSTFCSGITTTIGFSTNYATGGTWGSNNPSIATISAAGIVTVIAVGVDTITYRVYNACVGDTMTGIKVISVYQTPIIDSIVGPSQVCVNEHVFFTDSTIGGVWSTLHSPNNFVDSNGVLNVGDSTLNQLVTIQYTVTSNKGCRNSATTTIEIDASKIDTIKGPNNVCLGKSISLSDNTNSGYWTSSNNSIATVDSTGKVVGISLGTVTITYSVINACGALVPVTKQVTVNPNPSVAPIIGAASVCQGSNILLHDSTTGGVWASNSSSATVHAGNVFGKHGGNAAISYAVTNGFGCTTTVFKRVAVNSLPSITIAGATTGCDSVTLIASGGTSYSWDGGNSPTSPTNTFTQSGTYTYSTTNAAGCDSTARLHLTINSATTSSTSITACGSYAWNGVTYTTSGTYTSHFTNAVGCDSAATLVLTVKANSTSTTTASICAGGSYTFNGTAYTSAGSYTAQLTNSVGCDSAATLVLTVNSLSTSTTTESICAGGSYTFNGTTYSSAGIYTAHLTNSVGCDSAASLVLTVKSTSTSSTSVSVCSSALPYVWNGTSYGVAGTYTAHFTNSVGCDSAATLKLAVKAVSTSTTNASIYAGTSYTFNGTSYSVAGSYIAHLTNSIGCDSAATLNLTIITSITWTGATSTNWNTTTNWSPNMIPTSSLNAIIPANPTNPPVLNSNAPVDSLSLGDSLTLNDYTLTVSGAITRTNTNGTIKGSSASGLVMNGAAGSTLYFNQTTPGTTNVLNTLTINVSSGNISLGNALTITGILTPSQTSGIGILNTNGNLTLASTISPPFGTGTAVIAPSNCSGYINGNVTVQRYITAKTYINQNTQRVWEMLSSPIVAVQPTPPSILSPTSIFNNWQKQIYISGPSRANLISNPNSSGTYPSGTVCGTSLTAAPGYPSSPYNANYFDENYNENPSMCTYSNMLVNGSNYVTIPTTTNSTQPGLGYLVGVRGDRTDNTPQRYCGNQLLTNFAGNPDAVTLQTVGGVSTGDVTVNLPQPNLNTSTYNFNLMGNPYPCQISIDALYSHNSGTIYAAMWTICPGYFYNTGTYSTYSNGTITNITAGSGYTSYNAGANPNYNAFLIASGQGFLVQEKKGCTATSITFKESDKRSSTNVPSDAFFSVNDNSKLVRVGLRTNSNLPLDEVVVRLNSKGAKDYVSGWDAQSLNTGNQVITTLKDKMAFAIATHPDNVDTDTAQLGISSTEMGIFSLNFSDFDGMSGSYDILLRDKYLGVLHDVVANPTYSFNLTANTLSKGNNRFDLVFTKKGTIATIASESVTAAQKMTAYPNPAKDVLTIGGIGIGKSYTATIVTVLGKQVSTSQIVGGIGVGVNVKNLAAGVYLLELVGKKGEKQTIRFVKE